MLWPELKKKNDETVRGYPKKEKQSYGRKLNGTKAVKTTQKNSELLNEY